MADDPAAALAAHVARTRFEDLPESAILATQRDILDTFGCMLGGSGAPGIPALFGLLDEWGGLPEADVLLHGRGLPAHAAAMMNAAMGHALDFDDTHDEAGSIHPGCTVLAAALAIADRIGDASGRDVLLAVTLGLDVSCRIALAATEDRGWHRTAAIGIFGAAATAAKLLGATAGQVHHALGIAYSQAAGNRQCILDGALTKRLQAGQAASAGVVAALLAMRGVTGARDVFCGRHGFFAMYQPGGADPAQVTAALGHAFRGEGLSFKPYPCGRPLHATIDAVLAARAELGITRAEAVAAVTIACDPATARAEFGVASKRRPTQVVEAQFALPFLVAIALAEGRVGIGDVAGLGTPAVLALAERVTGEARAGLRPRFPEITLRHVDGRAATVAATDPIGSPEKPLGEGLLAAKFRDNARNALRPVPDEVTDAALARLAALRDMADIRALVAPFI
jgi:2-methylcitrate dehydratase PrpD